MKDLNFTEMFDMQKKLLALNPKWEGFEPKYARNRILWLVEELGESISIIKKKGDDKIMNDPIVREHFCTEMADVLMYLNDALLCYDITPQEIATAYKNKHIYNLGRNYNAQNKKLYSKKLETE